MKSAKEIEKLVKRHRHQITDETHNRVLGNLLKALQDKRKHEPPATAGGIGRFIMQSPVAKKVAAVLTIGAVAAALILVGMISRGPTEAGDGPTASAPRTLDSVRTEIHAIREMAAAGDVKGLATVVSTGPFESKLVAANFLAQMAPMPAFETVAAHAGGEIRVDRHDNRLRLGSTASPDWIELADSVLIVHSGGEKRQTNQVRLTYDLRGNSQQWQEHQKEFAALQQERAKLEKQVASGDTLPTDVNDLRLRLEEYSHLLDGMDEAIYVSAANGGLTLESRFRKREAHVYLSGEGICVEWHGHVVKADSITLKLGLAPVRTDGPPAPTSGWRSRFDLVYSLADGEVLRWVRTPFIPERRIYTTSEMRYHASENPPPPGYIFFRWDGKAHPYTIAMSEATLGSVASDLGLKRYEMDGPPELWRLRLSGDWIGRVDVPTEQKLDALERILQRELQRRIRFQERAVQRDVIVVRGEYERRFLEGRNDPNVIDLFSGPAPGRLAGGGRGSIAKVVEQVGARFNRPVVFETAGLDNIEVRFHISGSFNTRRVHRAGSGDRAARAEELEKLNSVLANLTRQTSLRFELARRECDAWFITEDVNQP